MGNRGLIFHCFEVLLMFLGLYLITVNLVVVAMQLEKPAFFEEVVTMYNFQAFHESNAIEYRGFKWFYEKLSSYPGLMNFRNLLTNISKYGSAYVNHYSGDNLFEMIKYICSLIATPFLLVGAFLADVISSAIWFFDFFVSA